MVNKQTKKRFGTNFSQSADLHHFPNKMRINSASRFLTGSQNRVRNIRFQERRSEAGKNKRKRRRKKYVRPTQFFLNRKIFFYSKAFNKHKSIKTNGKGTGRHNSHGISIPIFAYSNFNSHFKSNNRVLVKRDYWNYNSQSARLWQNSFYFHDWIFEELPG